MSHLQSALFSIYYIDLLRLSWCLIFGVDDFLVSMLVDLKMNSYVVFSKDHFKLLRHTSHIRNDKAFPLDHEPQTGPLSYL